MLLFLFLTTTHLAKMVSNKYILTQTAIIHHQEENCFVCEKTLHGNYFERCPQCASPSCEVCVQKLFLDGKCQCCFKEIPIVSKDSIESRLTKLYHSINDALACYAYSKGHIMAGFQRIFFADNNVVGYNTMKMLLKELHQCIEANRFIKGNPAELTRKEILFEAKLCHLTRFPDTCEWEGIISDHFMDYIAELNMPSFLRKNVKSELQMQPDPDKPVTTMLMVGGDPKWIADNNNVSVNSYFEHAVGNNGVSEIFISFYGAFKKIRQSDSWVIGAGDAIVRVTHDTGKKEFLACEARCSLSFYPNTCVKLIRKVIKGLGQNGECPVCLDVTSPLCRLDCEHGVCVTCMRTMQTMQTMQTIHSSKCTTTTCPTCRANTLIAEEYVMS